MRGVSSVHSRSSAASRLLLISIVQCRTICGGHMCLIIIRCSSMCTDFTECCISFSRKVFSMQCGRHGFQHFMFLFLEVEAWNPALLTDKSAIFFPWCETLLSGKYFAFCVSATVWCVNSSKCSVSLDHLYKAVLSFASHRKWLDWKRRAADSCLCTFHPKQLVASAKLKTTYFCLPWKAK